MTGEISMQMDAGIAIAVVGCAVGLAGWLRNRDTDKSGNIRQMTTLEVKLDTVIAGLAKIETAASKTEGCVQSLESKMASVESSIKSAHHRLDKIEGITKKEE